MQLPTRFNSMKHSKTAGPVLLQCVCNRVLKLSRAELLDMIGIDFALARCFRPQHVRAVRNICSDFGFNAPLGAVRAAFYKLGYRWDRNG